LTTNGDNTAAVAEQRTAIDLNPSFAMAHYGLGFALMCRGQAAEAVPEFEMARRLSPHDPYMWLFEAIGAVSHIMLGHFEVAEQLAQSSIRRAGAGFWAHASLASALGSLGRIEEARKALHTLLELQPDFSREWFDSVMIGFDPSLTDSYFDGIHMAGLEATKITSAAAD
jgi:Flp pilus assembly protein TadD